MTKLLLVSLISIAHVNLAFAEDSSLASHITDKLSLANKAFNEAQLQMSETNSEVEFKQFWLTLTASASFGINSVLSVQVSPEITFTWEKTAKNDP